MHKSHSHRPDLSKELSFYRAVFLDGPLNVLTSHISWYLRQKHHINVPLGERCTGMYMQYDKSFSRLPKCENKLMIWVQNNPEPCTLYCDCLTCSVYNVPI